LTLMVKELFHPWLWKEKKWNKNFMPKVAVTEKNPYCQIVYKAYIYGITIYYPSDKNFYWIGKMPKGRVLVIEDEEDIREVLRLHLLSAGYNVVEAENCARSEDNMVNVGLILCDIRMPIIDGAECVDILKKEAPEIPVVMVTGYPDTEMANAFLNKGVKDYLVKPVEKEKLLDVVSKIISAGKNSGL